MTHETIRGGGSMCSTRTITIGEVESGASLIDAL